MGVFYQVLCTGIACFLCMSSAILFTWPSSTIELFAKNTTTLSRPMTETEISLLGSLSSVGALISTPVIGILMDVVGRKYCAMAAALSHVIAWSMIAWFSQVEVVLFAVFISGVGGCVFLVISVYTSEICQESIRGAMTACTMLFYSIGMLLSYLMGGCLEYRIMIYVCLSLAVLGLVMLNLLRETPTYLLKKGLDEQAVRSFAFYRNARPDSKEVMLEMEKLRRAFNPQLEDEMSNPPAYNPEMEKLNPLEEKFSPEMELDPTTQAPAKKPSLYQFIKSSRCTRRAMLIMLVLVTAAVFQGLVVVQVYAMPLFQEAVPTWSPVYCSVLFAAVTIVASCIAAVLSDLAGRRQLMIFASLASCICCVGLGSQLQFHWAAHWVTALFIYLFTLFYSCGAGIIPFVVVSEVFLPEVKSFMSMFVIEWAWLCNFLILFIFNPLVSTIGLGPVFYLFAAICLMTSVYCVFKLPETKGLAVDAIQRTFS